MKKNILIAIVVLLLIACKDNKENSKSQKSIDEAWLDKQVEELRKDFGSAKNDIEEKEIKDTYWKRVYDYFDKKNNYIDSIQVRVETIEADIGVLKAEFKTEDVTFVYMDSYKDGDSVYNYFRSFKEGQDTVVSFGFDGVGDINDPTSKYFNPIIIKVYPVILNRQRRL